MDRNGFLVRYRNWDIETGGQKRFVHAWEPVRRAPWATLTIIHGFGEHGGRYDSFGKSLASLGLAVLAMDLVGHGRSDGRRGCIDSYDQLLDDVELALNQTRNTWNVDQRYLFGQSMGGNLVLNMGLRRSSLIGDIQGLLAGAPMLRTVKTFNQVVMNGGRWLSDRFPTFRFPTIAKPSLLSRNREIQKAFRRDPLNHSMMSIGLAMSLIEAGEWALEYASRLVIPTLVTHGTDDRLACPRASQEFVMRTENRAHLRVWANGRHDLHHDIPNNEYTMTLRDWMAAPSKAAHQCYIAQAEPSVCEAAQSIEACSQFAF